MGPISATRALFTLLHLDRGVAAARRFTDSEWAAVLGAAQAVTLTPVVASIAVRAGVIPDAPAAGWGGRLGGALQAGRLSARAALLVARREARHRTDDVLDQGRTILSALTGAGIAAVPLKGLHLLLDGVWPDPAGRPMRDLDLLVPPDGLRTAREVLTDLGYRPHELPYRQRTRLQPYGYLAGDHHDPPLSRPGRSGTVELHRRLLSRRHSSTMDTSAVLARAAGTGRLTVEDLLAHLVAHAQLTDHGRVLGQLPLCSILDVGYLLRRRPDLDLDLVRTDHPGLRAALTTQLRDVAYLTTGQAPAPVRLRWAAAAVLTATPRVHRSYQRALAVPRSLAGDRIREIDDGHSRSLTAARWAHVRRFAAQKRVAAPVNDPFRFADAIFCINLDARPDRWGEARHRFAALGIGDRVERVPAVSTPDNHHRGCAQSWRTVAALAHERGLDRVLVFEDDVVFLDDTAAILRLAAAELGRLDWDLFYLGACVRSQIFPFVPASQVLQRCAPVTCSHAVTLRRPVIEALLADLPDPALGAAAMDDWLTEWVAIDQYFSRRIGDGTFQALITWPRVATQPALCHYADADLAFAERYTI